MPLKNERRSRSRGEGKRVLVVDDEADIRELLDLTLARMGLLADCALVQARREGKGKRGLAGPTRAEQKEGVAW